VLIFYAASLSTCPLDEFRRQGYPRRGDPYELVILLKPRTESNCLQGICNSLHYRYATWPPVTNFLVIPFGDDMGTLRHWQLHPLRGYS
jgi:hypothetical protein